MYKDKHLLLTFVCALFGLKIFLTASDHPIISNSDTVYEFAWCIDGNTFHTYSITFFSIHNVEKPENIIFF